MDAFLLCLLYFFRVHLYSQVLGYVQQRDGSFGSDNARKLNRFQFGLRKAVTVAEKQRGKNVSFLM